MIPAPPTRPDPTSDEVARSGLIGTGKWHRLNPLSPIVRAGRALYVLLILLIPAIASGRREGAGFRFVGDVAATSLLVIAAVISWLVTRWRIEDGTLRIERGLIRRSSQRFPLVQIQAIDTVRPFLARVLGLAELRLRMAGREGGSGRLAYLTESEADALRARLLALAHGIAEHTPEPPQQVLLSVPTGRLIGSIVLTRLGLGGATVVAVLISVAVVSPAAAAATIGAGAASILALLTTLWRRFNGDFELTVSEAPDGIRLRAGLLTTSAETIPHGRVQAVRMIEPLLWRLFGWCRMQVDVAGSHRREGESEAEGRQLRAVLPVGTPEEARRLLERIMPDAPLDRSPPPARARLKTPLRYHHLSWGRNNVCAVTTSGRVARVTDWVPLAKVQSLRWVQGPVQRRLRLATIHLDTAGRNVHAAVRDRDAVEADRILADLIAVCRTARRSRQVGLDDPARTGRFQATPVLASSVRPSATEAAVPPRPDLAAPLTSVRWRGSGLETGLVAPLAWIGASWVAWRSLGWYPLPSAKAFFVLGWILLLALGLTLGLFRTVVRRRAGGVVLLVIALASPLLAARTLPGVKQPAQYQIPGRPWLALAASPNGTLDLYLMKGDASHVVAFGETSWTKISAALSPDRRHIAFTADRSGIYSLFLIDLDANGNRIGRRELYRGAGNGSDVTWSPGGREIAYSVRTGRSLTIDVIGADGGMPAVLVGNALNPAWSPDGRQIAYSAPKATDPDDYDIWIMRADGSSPRDVIDASSTDWSPKWSPDGRRIAFTAESGNNWDVYVANADGGGIRDLTQGSRARDEAGGWAPAGSKILFLSDRSHTGGTFLYFMDPDGANVRLALRL